MNGLGVRVDEPQPCGVAYGGVRNRDVFFLSAVFRLNRCQRTQGNGIDQEVHSEVEEDEQRTNDDAGHHAGHLLQGGEVS